MSLALTFNLRTALIVIAVLSVYAAVKFLIGQFSHKPEYYTEAEMESFQNAAEEAFGGAPFIFHEKFSPDIHIDILLFAPNERCPFFTACTMGVGAHRMNVPPTELREELQKEHPELNALMFPGWERTELLMYLPADWEPMWLKENASEEEMRRSYRPIEILKDAARYMVRADSWYAFSQTFSYGEPFLPGSDYVAMAFASPLPDCRTPGFTLKAGDKDVSVLHMLPLTQEEYEAAKANDAYEWLRNFLPADAESMVKFLRGRVEK